MRKARKKKSIMGIEHERLFAKKEGRFGKKLRTTGRELDYCCKDRGPRPWGELEQKGEAVRQGKKKPSPLGGT